MSLTDQLRALAIPITSSYVVDNVHRKSLIYDDASKVDTQSCYSNSLTSFKKLCEMENAFNSFNKTLFSVTSCHIEMCNLLPQEKEKLDSEISKFLCYISSFLKHYVAVQALEWLVYKFQIHLHNVEDFIRCIIPYHETGLFVKFIQILNFKQLPASFQWLKPYAESGKSISRQEFTRLCFREHTIIPFICTTILSYVEHCQNLVPTRLNDMTNFFLAIVTALCDSSAPDKKLINVLDSFQDVIRQGLLSENIIPFQCATFLVVIRFSLKLVINKELVLDWIYCILKKTRPSCEWESMRIVVQLMRNQRIALLPPKLAARQNILLSKLSLEEKRIIEEEQSALVNECEDPNKLAAECVQKFDYVRKATQLVDVDMRSEKLESKEESVPDDHSSKDEVKLKIDILHSFLSSIPNVGCCIMNCESSCPVEPLPKTDHWLSDVLLDIFPAEAVSNHDCGQDKLHYSKAEIRHFIKMLRLAKSAIKIHLESNKSIHEGVDAKHKSSRKSMTSSSLLGLLQNGIDKALPLLVASLSHSAATVRVTAFDILRLLFQDSPSKSITSGSNFSTFCTAVNLTSNFAVQIDELFSDEVRELLLGDPLHLLDKAASLLIKGVVRLLFSQPLKLDNSDDESEDKFSTICWMFGLRLLSEETIGEILLIPCSQSEDFVKGWSGLLSVIRRSHKSFNDLHHMCLARLNSGLFMSLEHFTVKNDLGSQKTSVLRRTSCHIQGKNTPGMDTCNGAQTKILDALYDLGHSEHADFDSVQKVFSRLNLNAVHFDYMFIKSDPSRTVHGDDRSLFARVTEARESRRRSLRLRKLKQPDLNNESLSEKIRLRFLSMLLSILTEAVPRLQSCEIAALVQSKSKSSDLNTSITTLETKSPGVDGKKSKDQNTPMNDLITPLVNHLTSLLNMEQHIRQSAANAANQTNLIEGSDTDSDLESLSGSISDIHVDQESVDISSPGRGGGGGGDDEGTCIRPLLRQCVYKLLVCITAILAEGNRIKRPRRKRSHWKMSTDHMGLLYGLAAAQVAVDPIFLCLTIYPDWPALHQQVLLCFIELSLMFPGALCQHLVSLVQWVACNRQLMRLDNAHNLSILGRLILVTVPALIRASSEQISTGLYVLYLFVMRFSEFSSNLNRRRLALYTVLVRGLSQVTGPFMTDSEINRGVLPKSLTDEEKSSKKMDTSGRVVETKISLRPKDSWLGSWLWVSSLIFLNKNWQTQSIADEVGPFLIDLFCHFGWDHQVVGLCECIDFLIYLCANSCDYKIHEITGSESSTAFCIEIEQPKKRRKLSASYVNPNESPTNNTQLVALESQSNENDTHSSSSSSFSQLASFIFNSDKVCQTNETVSKILSMPAVVTLSDIWSLVNRTVQFIVVLIKNPDYCAKVQEAFKDPSGLSAVYGRLVEHIVQLMLIVATFSTKVRKSGENVSEVIACSDEALSALQSIVVQILDSVPGRVFISMVSSLFASDNRGLRRKALDLLSAKLSNLTANIHPVPILVDFNKMNYKSYLKSHKQLINRNLVNLDNTLETGLVQFTGKLTSFYGVKSNQLNDSQIQKSATVFGSPFSRQCLACLRSLAKLLAYRYPGEFMRALDSLMSLPGNWWISVGPTETPEVLSDTGQTTNPRSLPSGSSLAESRSLACLFFVECLQRLPPQSLYPEASATSSRLGWLLSFALDHACTCTSFIPSPRLSAKRHGFVNSPYKSEHQCKLITGSMHSRDQHLLASLTLISNLLEIAIIHRLCYQSKSDHTPDDTESAIGKWLEFGLATKKKATHSPVAESASITLLSLLFQLRKDNLSVLTNSNPERCGHILRQIANLVDHIHQLLRHVTEISYLLTTIQRVIEKASKESNNIMLHGSLSFLSDFGESMAPVEENGTFTTKDESQLHSFSVLHATKPDFIWRLLRTCLRSVVNSMLNTVNFENTTELENNDMLICLYRSIASLISSLPDEDARFRVCQQLFNWSNSHSNEVQPDSADDAMESDVNTLDEMFVRLSIVFRIMERIPNYMNAEEYSEMTKQLFLVDHIVLVFIIAVGQKFKGAKKIANRLGFTHSLRCYADGATPKIIACVRSSLSCLQKWLIGEVKNVACLDAASAGESTLYIPSVLIGLLDVSSSSSSSSNSSPITEIDLQSVLASFLDAVCGDEAFLRPLGSALTERIMHSSSWRTRLAGIRLLKFVFNHSRDQSAGNNNQGVVIDSKHPGPVNCIISDSLLALSEALEDDRPEVEAEANKLFAELEQMGLTATETRTN
uniref:HEAT repeat-containing protein 1 n=1 Tax=Trichobilharzia regenti TaxID=157069 RepID=A0AA85KIF9_TRIRE|nr:unnamed protein product [Trichobilharzia regenti]